MRESDDSTIECGTPRVCVECELRIGRAAMFESGKPDDEGVSPSHRATETRDEFERAGVACLLCLGAAVSRKRGGVRSLFGGPLCIPGFTRCRGRLTHELSTSQAFDFESEDKRENFVAQRVDSMCTKNLRTLRSEAALRKGEHSATRLLRSREGAREVLNLGILSEYFRMREFVDEEQHGVRDDDHVVAVVVAGDLSPRFGVVVFKRDVNS